MSRAETQERIVAAAHELFYTHGYQATGVDRIAEAAGVTKKTLYSHFDTKTDLIVAALRKRSALYLDRFTGETARHMDAGADLFTAVFEALEAWIESYGHNGCMFMNALSEYDVQGPYAEVIHAEVEAHKRENIKFLAALARRAGVDNPEQVGRQLALLIEGTTALARLFGARQTVADAKRLLAAQGLAGVAAAGRRADDRLAVETP